MPSAFLNVNQIIFSVSNLQKVAVDEKTRRVLVFVKDRNDPFVFDNNTSDEAAALFTDFCNWFRRSQPDVPFLYFAHIALKLELLTGIHVDGNTIVVSAVGFAPDVVAYSSKEATEENFNRLLVACGLLAPDALAPQQEKEKTEVPPASPPPPMEKRKSAAKKPPDKSPRKASRVKK